METEKRFISLDEALNATHKEVYWTESEAAAIRSFLVKLPRVDAIPMDDIKLHRILIDNEGVPEVKLQIGDRYFIIRTDPVDVREVVHGWWVIEKRHTVSQNPYMDDNYHAHATCSECGFCIHSVNASFGYPKLNITNYCPNCGAKMDEETEDTSEQDSL